MATDLAPSPEASDLTARLVGIGIALAGPCDPGAPIEETLVDASVVGMDAHDLRVLGLVTAWLGVHADHVNADRLVRIVGLHRSPRVRAYWAAFAGWRHVDRRFARLASTRDLGCDGPVELLPVGTAFQVARRGEDGRFAGTGLLVPAGTLRDRPADILPPSDLARRHAGYRNRVLMGPTWRADAWTILEAAPGLTVAEVARRTGCAYATAWSAARDFRILHHPAHETAPAAG